MKCDAHLAENLFQTRSGTTMIVIAFPARWGSSLVA
ncbi:MAG: DUF6783 domain-containing protein [Blautia wexlerae]